MRSIFNALIFSALTFSLGSQSASAADPIRAVGTPSGKPFTFLNVETNKLQGVLVDLINEVAKEEKFEVRIDTIPWASIIPALTSNRADVSIAASVITPARAEVVDFTVPLFPYGEGLVLAASDNRDISSLKQLEGQAIGVQVGTTYYKHLQDSGVKLDIRAYESVADILRDLNLGRIQAGMFDYPILSSRRAEGDKTFRFSPSYKSQVAGNVGFMVAKGNPERVARLNAGIKKLKESGRLQQILDKWGVSKTSAQ